MPEQQDNKGWQEAIRRIKEAKRTNATSLDLSYIALTTIPYSLAQLAKLEILDLNGNQITAIPDSLAQLANLSLLDLKGNQITAIPDSLAQLTNLHFVDLRGNQITTIPECLAQLANLQHLYLSGNQITAIPDSLAQLANLQRLDLSGNQITLIPDCLAQLANLQRLNLSGNQITVIADSLAQLANLQTLILDDNQITAIPHSLTQLIKLQRLELSGNPLPDELFAALKQGIPTFFRHLEATAKRKVFPRTVKLVLLGEPKSGKTTLLEALKGNQQPCDESRKETLGVNVVTLEKPHPTDHEAMYLSAWDFAGQHMEQATHQFFLTENAIYLILWHARQGTESGKRDLWYWLELLKMRVREPKFLLVATHTEHTPPDLNLSEIHSNYQGCQGHFPIELSSLKGVAALEAKILALAADSPALRAAWPPEWLEVRNAVRKLRLAQPHMTPTAFRSLMEKNGVSLHEMQKDLAGQLHSLGEILYYQEREELANLVILDPEWMAQLIALVVRSTAAREQHGILRKGDLDKLWSNEQLQPSVQNHLISLMDWFDLTYSTGQASEPGIVVEALPYSMPADRKQIELPAGRPQMEMIFRFPSLQRHLPPGIPTWGIARAHRLAKCTPWRDAAGFHDSETNSHAVILASDAAKEIRLRVTADYPPFFFGRLEAILRDTFKRYPGAVPERRFPCSCQPDCPESYPYEIVLKRWHDRKKDVICTKSGDDVAIESLLSGAKRTDTEEGLLALKAEMRRQFTEHLRVMNQAMNQQMENTCPSVFTLLPAREFKQLDTWLESVTQKEELELVLYCQHDPGWHDTAHSVYRFRTDQEWFSVVKKGWNRFVGVTKYVGPLVKSAGKLGKVGGMVLEKLPEVFSEDGGISERLGQTGKKELVDIETRHLLKELIHHVDAQRGNMQPKNGGLHPYIIDDGRLLWLCPEHLKQYQTRA